MTVLRRATGVAGELMITVGCLLLLFVAWQLWWTDVSSNRVQEATIGRLEQDFGRAGNAPSSAPTATPQDPEEPADPGDPLATLKDVPMGAAFAILRIPRLGADYARPVLEGTDYGTLTRGVGHYDGSVMPGEIGNFAVAGHRTTYGRPFHDVERLERGDVLIVETKTAYDVYRVDRHVIVRPTEVDVIAAVPRQAGARATQAWMTMTSCHPKFSAQYRYVVFSRFERSFPRTDGLPASYLTVAAKAA